MAGMRSARAAIWVTTFCGATAWAGDLSPPAGPIAPTQRRLISSLPFTANQAGSYVVTGHLSGTGGINITASDVQIDLNGFTLACTGGTPDGISTVAAIRNVTIINGVLRDWGFAGVYLQTATNCEIRNLKVYNSNLEGIVLGKNSRVLDCLVDGLSNTTKGIVMDENCTVLGSTCLGCAVSGIQLGNYAVVAQCIARQNGSFGIRVGERSVVDDCTVSGNDLLGINLGNSSTANACVVSGNQSIGISAGANCLVAACTTNNNGTAGTGGSGISVSTGSSVVQCASSSNGAGAAGGHGIVTGDRCSVVECHATQNRGDGIRIGGRYTNVIGNTCAGNTLAGSGAGIRAILGASGVRIDSNHVAGNDAGITVDDTGNIITRNSAALNTNNYGLIVGGNDVGPVGTAAGSTSPWSNVAL